MVRVISEVWGQLSVSGGSLLIPLPALKGFFVLSHWPDDPAAVSSPFSQHNQWNRSGCSTSCTYKALLYVMSNCVAYKWDCHWGDRQPRYFVSEGNAPCDIVMRQLIKQLSTVRPVIVTGPFVLGKWHFHQVNRGFVSACVIVWCVSVKVSTSNWVVTSGSVLAWSAT